MRNLGKSLPEVRAQLPVGPMEVLEKHGEGLAWAPPGVYPVPRPPSWKWTAAAFCFFFPLFFFQFVVVVVLFFACGCSMSLATLQSQRRHNGDAEIAGEREAMLRITRWCSSLDSPSLSASICHHK